MLVMRWPSWTTYGAGSQRASNSPQTGIALI
jgi:hypothetical protein